MIIHKALIISLIAIPLLTQAEDGAPAAYQPTKEELEKKQIEIVEKAKQEKDRDIERNENEKVEYFNNSYSKVINLGIVDIRKACNPNDDWNYRGFRTSNLNIEECIKAITPKVNQLKADLRTKKIVPNSCAQWALIRAPEWSNPKFYMEYNPIIVTKSPVSFNGKIQDGNNKSLSLAHMYENNYDGKNVIINIVKHTYFINPTNVAINRNISGVGTPNGAQKVKLINGAYTTIPIIQAECID